MSPRCVVGAIGNKSDSPEFWHVPAEIQVHSLPAEAEKLAPQLRGFGYVVVEELVAIVEPRTRKIEVVFPRWGGE